MSWNSGCVPGIWKTATIVPIPKQNKDLSQPKSHRPISLTSAIVKWMERILLARLSFFLDKNSGRATSQAGSRIKHETTDLLHLKPLLKLGFKINNILWSFLLSLLRHMIVSSMQMSLKGVSPWECMVQCFSGLRTIFRIDSFKLVLVLLCPRQLIFR